MLGALTADARISVRALADRLNISRANAYSRLERLTREGVITGFSARIDPHLAGLGTSAYVMLSVEQTAWRELKAALRDIPYVEHIALVGGDFDVLLLVRARTTPRCARWCWSTSRRWRASAPPGPG